MAAARHLNETIARPNLLVKIPGTAEGVPAIRQMISEGRSINVTLIFSLGRYGEVMEAYLSGLEACDGDLSGVHSVASFFVSRVDTEVDRRLEAIGSPEALALRGKAAVAQAKLAYQQFSSTFAGPRWEALAARGAHLQRPLWASTSTKNPAYPDTLYVDSLIGPDTVNTLPDATIEAFADHGTIARTIDGDLDEVRRRLDGAGRRRRRHGRRRRAARARGRVVVPEELRRAARRADDEGQRAAALTAGGGGAPRRSFVRPGRGFRPPRPSRSVRWMRLPPGPSTAIVPEGVPPTSRRGSRHCAGPGSR